MNSHHRSGGKTAFAYWDNRIAPVFDTTQQITVVEVGSGGIVRESQERLPVDSPVRTALRLGELEIGTLVCGAISRSMHELVTVQGIQVVPFVAGDLPKVIRAWLDGVLDGNLFKMPGYRDRQDRRFTGMHEGL